MELRDAVVLITGATGALGRVVVKVFAETGARLALTARSTEALAHLEHELDLDGQRVMAAPADLAVERDVNSLVSKVTERWGGIDVLLNIAGGWQGGQRVAEVSLELWEATFAMNLRSAFLVNRAVLAYMAKRGWGRIVNVASRAAVEPGPRQVAYNAAKAGVVALTASIASEYRRQGVVANVVLPSIIDTPDNRAQMPEAEHGRWVKPEELASVMLFLCGKQAKSINGASIPVYGRL